MSKWLIVCTCIGMYLGFYRVDFKNSLQSAVHMAVKEVFTNNENVAWDESTGIMRMLTGREGPMQDRVLPFSLGFDSKCIV